MKLFSSQHWAVVWIAKLFHQLQLGRLWISGMFERFFYANRFRILSTACWGFPIYSQTFVHQELTQLIRAGCTLKFLYGKQESRDQLSDECSELWPRRRRMILHPDVCKSDYKYYSRRMPEKIGQLVELLSMDSGMPPEEIHNHKHFLQAFTFTRMVQAYRPNYLHSYFFYEGTLFSFVASYLLNIPRGMSCYADHMLKDYELKVVPLHLSQCNLIIATSQRIKRELLQLQPSANVNNILVKPNAINPDYFQSRRNPERPDDDLYRIVSVNRIEPKKGLVYLVDAMKEVRDAGLNVQLSIVGGVDKDPVSIAYAEEVKAKIHAFDLENVVRLEGWKSQEEIKKFLNDAHLFIAPFIQTDSGDKDGIPTSLLEAMASGLAVIATDAGSIPEVMENGREGILVPQRDSSAISAAIIDLVRNKEKQRLYGENAARRIREAYDVAVTEKIFHRRLARLLKSYRMKPDGKDLVSVIIIFFNAERYFEEAIQSVFNQIYENWELLLVDDGSTDRSTEIATKYATSFPDKVRYLDHPAHENRGMSATRNLGIQRAAGNYIAFLDSDDVWLPHKLERQMAIVESHPEAAMVCGATQYWYSWTDNPEDAHRDFIPDLGLEADTLYDPPSLLPIIHPLGLGTAPCPSDLLLRKDAIHAVHGFEEHYRGIYQIYEDQAFLVKMYLTGSVFISGECWDKYRIHPDSCLSTVTKNGQYEIVRQYFLDWFKSYLLSKGLNSGVAWNSLHLALAAEKPVTSADNNGWGSLRRTTPVSRNWGLDRGLPIDRYYIEKFLALYSSEIRGRTLEIEDDMYTRRFGGEQTTIRDILHVNNQNSRATIIGDLTQADHIPSDAFDCLVITQTLQLIYDVRSAIRTLHRILKPGGILLATFPGILRLSQSEWANSWFWGFTTASAQRLFSEIFAPENVQIESCGNVLAGIAYLHGFAVEEFTKEELDYKDPDYELLISVRAVKSPKF